MKKLFFSVLILSGLAVQAQNKEMTPATPGVTYGVVDPKNSPIPVEELPIDDSFKGQIKGKVVEVCKAEGCWIKVQRYNSTPVMVKVKDHAFLMPESIVGKTVIIEGSAAVKEVSEEMRKHYAEDAGKSKKEIAKIKGSEKDVQFSATGVKVIE
jgi:hypothetical protein